MKLADLAFACYVYTHMSNYDSSYLRFVEQTYPELDLKVEAHQGALLNWLNAWGCRQFAKSHHILAAEEIRRWYDEIGTGLFPRDKSLLLLSEEDLDFVERAYGFLVKRTASLKHRGGESIRVEIGPTGTAKILFALRPNALLPWDEPIRFRFKADGSAQSYAFFLRLVQGMLKTLALDFESKGHTLAELPALLGRPTSSPAKMIDEYFWVTISRKCPVPKERDLMRWVNWR
jgi:hypothetical protein